MVVFNGVFPVFPAGQEQDELMGLTQEIWIFLQNYTERGKQV